MTMEKRLNKFISESGFCSRREADKLIEQSRVTINGQIPELGTKVGPGDRVAVDGRTIKASASDKADRVYIAYNKPIGITCTTERDVYGNIIDAIGHKQRIFPIGRLDKPSEGLIFLTSDGDIVNKILRAENAHDKEYIVTVDKPVSERFIERMSRGVPILGTVTKPCKCEVVSRFVFKIILTQGLNRQIRRMCEYLDYDVVKLKRSRIMNVGLDGLKPGAWRNLTEQEMAEINSAVAGSSKTAANTTQPSADYNSPRRIKPQQDKPRSGNPRRPSGQGEGRGVLDKPSGRSGGDNRPSGSKPKVYVNPNAPKGSHKPNKPAKPKAGGSTLKLKRK
ncbi:23S rRNA pseudouridine(2604) synthase RluF [Ferrimonas lipolytica]|uniref:Pseudouridine synthase n=1 Tax=Ferrimonas lipolytica TaxID=2724191 RepID=A0A6H1UGS9_9GAMM|nr:23S rRNA pseudouridine(2604) synthase RluF [Ferrimonas lipolytica]QIZ78315.1 23S rRNA pseudouridine(2604) synthase RluF [Ferrimonas lipolytica]